jgi:hypothetical protein
MRYFYIVPRTLPARNRHQTLGEVPQTLLEWLVARKDGVFLGMDQSGITLSPAPFFPCFTYSPHTSIETFRFGNSS